MTHPQLTFVALLATMLLASCGGASGPSAPVGPSTSVSLAPTASHAPSGSALGAASPKPSSPVWNMVAFGDSWPEGAHCGGCRTFVQLWADGIERATGHRTRIWDLNGSREPGLPEGTAETSTTLLEALRSQPVAANTAADADIILIATGPNQIELAIGPLLAGTCGGSDDLECVHSLGRLWEKDFDEILTEIERLRNGKPTAIRLVSAANPFVSVPEMSAGMKKDFPSKTGALIFEVLTDAMCGAAQKHHAVCVDARPVLNGPSLLRPVDENSGPSMQAIADALVATGVPELTP